MKSIQFLIIQYQILRSKNGSKLAAHEIDGRDVLRLKGTAVSILAVKKIFFKFRGQKKTVVNLRAILSPSFWHMKSMAESIIRSVMSKLGLSSVLRQRREALRKSFRHGRVLFTGVLKQEDMN